MKKFRTDDLEDMFMKYTYEDVREVDEAIIGLIEHAIGMTIEREDGNFLEEVIMYATYTRGYVVYKFKLEKLMFCGSGDKIEYMFSKSDSCYYHGEYNMLGGHNLWFVREGKEPTCLYSEDKAVC